jgi:hypothetical protein
MMAVLSVHVGTQDGVDPGLVTAFAARASSSVTVRKRFQSVLGSVFEPSPEVSSFMGFGPPCRYKLSLISVAIGVDHRNLDAVIVAYQRCITS